MRVLVVDSDEFFARNLCEFIEQFYELKVQYESSGLSALALLEKEAFDLIITDVYFPDISADVWLLKLKEMAQEVPVIISTSFGYADFRQFLKAMNVISYLEKPYEMQILANLIGHLCDCKKVQR